MAWNLVFDDREMFGQWVAEQVGQKSSWGGYYAMGAIDDTGRIGAGIVMNNINESNATVHIAIKHPGKYLPELFHHFCKYVFVQLKLKRITGLVPASNQKVLDFDKKLGFEEEYLMPDGASDGAMQILVMRPETCRWLEGR